MEEQDTEVQPCAASCALLATVKTQWGETHLPLFLPPPPSSSLLLIWGSTIILSCCSFLLNCKHRAPCPPEVTERRGLSESREESESQTGAFPFSFVQKLIIMIDSWADCFSYPLIVFLHSVRTRGHCLRCLHLSCSQWKTFCFFYFLTGEAGTSECLTVLFRFKLLIPTSNLYVFNQLIHFKVHGWFW